MQWNWLFWTLMKDNASSSCLSWTLDLSKVYCISVYKSSVGVTFYQIQKNNVVWSWNKNYVHRVRVRKLWKYLWSAHRRNQGPSKYKSTYSHILSDCMFKVLVIVICCNRLVSFKKCVKAFYIFAIIQRGCLHYFWSLLWFHRMLQWIAVAENFITKLERKQINRNGYTCLFTIYTVSYFQLVRTALSLFLILMLVVCT